VDQLDGEAFPLRGLGLRSIRGAETEVSAWIYRGKVSFERASELYGIVPAETVVE